MPDIHPLFAVPFGFAKLESPEALNDRLRGAYSHAIQHFRLEAGQLILFPSWVLHDVKPFEGEGERITVAFNCWFHLPDTR